MVGVTLAGATLVRFPGDGQSRVVNAVTGVDLAIKLDQSVELPCFTCLESKLVGGHIELDARVNTPDRKDGLLAVVVVIYPGVIEPNAA